MHVTLRVARVIQRRVRGLALPIAGQVAIALGLRSACRRRRLAMASMTIAMASLTSKMIRRYRFAPMARCASMVNAVAIRSRAAAMRTVQPVRLA